MKNTALLTKIMIMSVIRQVHNAVITDGKYLLHVQGQTKKILNSLGQCFISERVFKISISDWSYPEALIISALSQVK